MALFAGMDIELTVKIAPPRPKPPRPKLGRPLSSSKGKSTVERSGKQPG